MKKYALLDKDLSALVSEVDSHLLANGTDTPEYRFQLYHHIGITEDLVDTIPSLETAFSDEGLTLYGIGHWCIDDEIRGIPSKKNLLVVPLKNTEGCIFHIMELKPDALPYVDPEIGHNYYPEEDCDIVESFAISGPIWVGKDALHGIENPNSDLAEFIVVAFNEDLSSYFE